jgi:hypothetical protein
VRGEVGVGDLTKWDAKDKLANDGIRVEWGVGMKRSGRRDTWLRSTLAVVLLVAGIGAPHGNGAGSRFLLGLGHAVAHGPTTSVRPLAAVGVLQGFRAVVGVTRGEVDVATNPPSSPLTIARVADRFAPSECPRADRPGAVASFPLRC